MRTATIKNTNDSKKMMTAPVKPHIYKMLRRDYHYDGVLELNKRLHFFGHTNTKAIRQYFLIPRDDMKTITVLMPRINEKKVYAMVRGFEKEFKSKMHLYILAQTAAGKSALAAMKMFLGQYDISSEEYDYAAAYKSWQRFQSSEGERANIRLWV